MWVKIFSHLHDLKAIFQEICYFIKPDVWSDVHIHTSDQWELV